MLLKKYIQPVLFFVILAAILLLSDLSNRQKNTIREKEHFDISIVHWIDAPAIERVEEGLFSALKDCGLEEEKNIFVSVFKASSDISMLNSIFKQLLNQKPDLIFVTCTPALQAAINHIKEIPVVYAAVADPILVGAGTDAEHHLENITGGCLSNDFESMCQIITENAPHIKTLGSIYCPGEIISVKYKDDYIKIASKYGLEVKFFPANNASELPDAVLGMITSKIDAVCQMGDNLMSSGVSTLIKGVKKANIPYFSFNQSPPGSPMECLVEIDIDYFQNGYDAGLQAKQILLDGKKPGDIPFNPPTKSEVRLNPLKAREYGIEFSTETKQGAVFVKGEKEPFASTQKIAMVHFVSSPDCDDVTKGILQRFSELGHVEGEDFIFDRYNANADAATLNEIVKVVSEKKYDIIFVTVLAATQALASGITDVPILFTIVVDPPGNGLGKSYTDHKKNLTGIDGMSFPRKEIELLKKYIPEPKKIGTLFCPGEMASVSSVEEMQRACDEYGIGLIKIPVNSVSEVADATHLLCMKKIDAICQLPDNCTIPGFSTMVKISRKENVPLFSYITSQVEMGAIGAVAGDFIQQGKEIANTGIRVINGESPEDIPFCRIKHLKTVINIDAAEAYGLKTPESFIKTADQVFGHGK